MNRIGKNESGTMNQAKAKSRIEELDAIRGIGCLLVVFSHYTWKYPVFFQYKNPDSFLQWCMNHCLGYYAIHLFYILSGFVIFMTLNRITRPLDFVISRFSRLYPVYWTAVILTFTLVSLCGLPGQEVSSRDALVNLTMFQSFIGFPMVDGCYWTIFIELLFYGVMFSLYCLGLLRYFDKISVAWLSSIFVFHYFNLTTIPLLKVISTILFFKYAHLFIAGIMFYRIFMKESSWKTHFIIFACLGVQYFVEGEGIIYVGGIFAILYLFSYQRLSFIICRPLLFLGSISYGFYLIHQNIGYIIINKFNEFPINHWYGILVSIATTMTLAYGIKRFVDVPAAKFITSRYQKFKMKQVLPVSESLPSYSNK